MGLKIVWGILFASLAACSFDSTGQVDDSAPEALGQSGEELRRGLNKKQEAIALKAIDDICGDTWCEGDHNFRFDRLECKPGCGSHAGSCTLRFRVFSFDTDIETGPTYSRDCRTTGFTGFESLVATFGDYHSLQPAYYAALSDCIDRIERDLPR